MNRTSRGAPGPGLRAGAGDREPCSSRWWPWPPSPPQDARARRRRPRRRQHRPPRRRRRRRLPGRRRVAASPAAATASPTTSPSPSASTVPQAPCPSAKATYASCGFPTARNTGWASAGQTSLKNVTSPGPTGQGSAYSTEIRTNGAVISGINLTGSLDVYANNVTIKNCKITTRNWFGINQRNGHHGLKIFNCTITGVPGKGLDHGGEDDGISDGGGQMEVAHNNIYGFGEGTTSGEGYFHDNYVHSLQSYIPLGSHSYQHTNALIDSGGSGIRIVHNTFLNWMPPRAGGLSPLMLAYDSARSPTPLSRTTGWPAARTACTRAGSPGRRTSSSRATSSALNSSPAAGSTGSTPPPTGTPATGTSGAGTSGPTAGTPARPVSP